MESVEVCPIRLVGGGGTLVNCSKEFYQGESYGWKILILSQAILWSCDEIVFFYEPLVAILCP